MSIASCARQAVSYTQGILGSYPSNHGLTRLLTLGGSLQCVREVRAGVRPKLDYDLIMNIRRRAAAAKTRRCGNCGEYACVAFDYLLLTRCSYPIEFAYYAKPGDHAFVIVGRPFTTVTGDPSTWGRDVVVCDAWAGRVVPSAQYWSGMVGYPNSVHAPIVEVRWPLVGDHSAPSRDKLPA